MFKRQLSLKQLEISWGMLFISPWIIGFVLLTVIPVFHSFYLSFTKYSLTNPRSPEWVGLDNYSTLFSLEVKQLPSNNQYPTESDVLSPNYKKLFRIGNTIIGAKDPIFWQAWKTNFLFALFAIPTSTVLGLSMALLFNMRVPLLGFFRTLVYLPSVLPAVPFALITLSMFNTYGWINGVLQAFGLGAPNWLGSETYIWPALVIQTAWGIGNLMILFLAAIQGVPTELYDAAKVDGANVLQRFRHVTIPMISPLLFYNCVMMLIASSQMIIQAQVVESQATSTPLYSYVLHIQREGWTYGNMGYAAALAWVLVLAVGMVVWLAFKMTEKRIFYFGQREA